MAGYEQTPISIPWQPKMHGEPTEYRLWAWQGEVQTRMEEALKTLAGSGGALPVGLANLPELLPAVLVTGLIDSVNPCAFAVILLLIAFLFTLRQSRGHILQLGFVYIVMIIIVYFGRSGRNYVAVGDLEEQNGQRPL